MAPNATMDGTPLPVVVPTYRREAILPIEVTVPMKVVAVAKLIKRKYVIVDREQEVPIAIIDWMKTEARYASLFT